VITRHAEADFVRSETDALDTKAEVRARRHPGCIEQTLNSRTGSAEHCLDGINKHKQIALTLIKGWRLLIDFQQL
jgi:hypothetical protein